MELERGKGGTVGKSLQAALADRLEEECCGFQRIRFRKLKLKAMLVSWMLTFALKVW